MGGERLVLGDQSETDRPMSQISIRYIRLDDIELDTRNPRVAALAEGFDSPPTRTWMLMALGRFSSDSEDGSASTSYSSLKASIRAGGGIAQPIIVTPVSPDKYVVIEGNTRVAIYLELKSETQEAVWDTIPAIVRSEADEKEEHAIRLQAHLVGPRPWRPYAKAKYLHDLYNGELLSLTEIHNHCGGVGKKREIEEYIQAYADMREHYVPMVEDEGGIVDHTRFSAFVELQKPQIVAALTRHGYGKQDFAKWVHEARFTPLNTVRHLPRILANANARQKFLSRNATEALRILEQPASSEVIKDASLEQLAAALTLKFRNLSWAEANSMIEQPDSRPTQAILDCYAELRGFARQLGVDDE